MRPLLAVAVAAALMAACSGPKPAVRSALVEPPSDGKANVTVVVENRGDGDGQVRLKVTLRDADGQVVAREDKTLDLDPHTTVTVVLEVQVPEDASDLRVTAEVAYPPD